MTLCVKSLSLCGVVVDLDLVSVDGVLYLVHPGPKAEKIYIPLLLMLVEKTMKYHESGQKCLIQ